MDAKIFEKRNLLRLHYASQALAGLLANERFNPTNTADQPVDAEAAKRIAESAFLVAEAMLDRSPLA